MLLMYMPVVFMQVFLIVKEKETNAKESMRMMGMKDFAYWGSWFFSYSLINTISVSLATGILAINVVQYSKIGYIWLFLWLYGEAIFGLVVTLQALFRSGSFSGIISTIVYFGGSLIQFAVSADTTSTLARAFASILP